MNYFNVILGLLFLIILQVMVVPLNLSFLCLVAISLFTEKLSHFILIGILAAFISVLGNLNPGLVLVSVTLSFLIISFLRNILPENNFSRGILIIFSLPLIEVIMKFCSRLIL